MSSADHSVLKHHFDNMEQQRSSERLGMWMFLVTEVLFFSGLFAGYTVYRMRFPEEFAAVSSKLSALIATINTFVLLISSMTITLAIRSAQLKDKKALLRWLWITALLGITFLGFKTFEYATDVHERLVPGTIYTTAVAEGKGVPHELHEQGVSSARAQLFLSFYYTMTGIHVIHLIVGIGCVLWLIGEVYKGKLVNGDYSTVETVSLYWHLVDMIWLFLVPLLYLAGTPNFTFGG